MSRELWLLRHGKSDQDTDVPDFERPLKKRGKRASTKIGAWMQARELCPDWIVSSPAERTAATSERVCEELGLGKEAFHQDKRLYASSVELFREVLSEIPATAERVLLVGHNPEMEQFLIEMVGMANLPYRKKLFPTATLAGLAMPDKWKKLQPESARLIEIVYAKSLFEEN